MFVHRTYFAKRGRQNRAGVIPVNKNMTSLNSTVLILQVQDQSKPSKLKDMQKKYANSFSKRNFRSNGIHQRKKSMQSNPSFLTNTTFQNGI